jgi:hypothetical protein
MSTLRILIAACALVAPAVIAQVAVTAPAGAVSPARVAGKVVLVEGEARFIDHAGAGRRPAPGDRILEGERLATGANGEVHLAMADGGYIGVRPDTDLRIDVFKADGASGDRSEISLIKGSFRTVTGWIGSAGAALIHTFDATIGVRGTDHEPLVVPAGAARGEPGTYDRVYVGATFIRTPEGTLEIEQGRTGFAPRGEAMSAEVLAVTPSLYQPTRNEARFAGLNDRIHGQLEKLRQDRRSGEGRDDERGSGSADRIERPAKTDRPERPERADRPDKPDKPDRAQRPDKPEKPERPHK